MSALFAALDSGRYDSTVYVLVVIAFLALCAISNKRLRRN